MSKSFQRSIFGVSVLLLLLTVWGSLRSNVRADQQKDGAYQEMEVYSEVLNKIQNDYVVDPNMSKVTVGALHGLLEWLDSDSSYLTPAEYKLYKQHLSEGTAQVGLNVSKRYGYATVVSVVPGSPADKEQIRGRRSDRGDRGPVDARVVAGDDPAAAGRADGNQRDLLGGAATQAGTGQIDHDAGECAGAGVERLSFTRTRASSISSRARSRRTASTRLRAS